MEMPGRAGEELAAESNGKLTWLNKFAVDCSRPCCRLLEDTMDHEAVWCKSVQDKQFLESLPYVDTLWLSPSCDKYSSNSKQCGDSLLLDSLAYIEKHLPKAVMVEQVRGITFAKHKDMLTEFKSRLKAKGYKYKCGILNSKDFYVPQERQRWILIAVHKPKRKLKWPTGTRTWDPSVDTLPLVPFNKDTDVKYRLPPPNPRSKNRERVLVKRAIAKSRKLGLCPKDLVVDIGCSLKYAVSKHNIWPTMTRTRCASKKYWVLRRGRQVRLSEIARSFGLKSVKPLLSSRRVTLTQLCRMFGNTVVFDVCKAIIAAALDASGFYSP